jgi:cell wall-associated NlpC family hydrolase
MIHWSNRFVGIPYVEFGRDRDGVDCWGLAVLVYRELRGIELPSYTEGFVSSPEREELAALINNASDDGLWTMADSPASLDVAVFRRGALETHVGIITNIPGYMLHAAAGGQSKHEAYDAGRWSHRLTGIYRHREMSIDG